MNFTFLMFQCIYSQLTTKIVHKEITLNIIYSYIDEESNLKRSLR